MKSAEAIDRNTSFMSELEFEKSEEPIDKPLVVNNKRKNVELWCRRQQHKFNEHVNIAETAHSLQIFMLGLNMIRYSWNGSHTTGNYSIIKIDDYINQYFEHEDFTLAELIDHGLRQMPAMHTLDLSNFCTSRYTQNIQNIRPEEVLLLENVLSKMPNLKTLNISGNAIGSDGASHLVHALDRVPKLQNLDIGMNEIGPEGAYHLTQSFDRVPLLRQLRIGHNKLGAGGLTLLSALCKRDEIRWKSMLAARCLSSKLPFLVLDLLLSYLPQCMELVEMENNGMTREMTFSLFSLL